MRLIDADLMAIEESEAYMSAQTKVEDTATKLVNEVVHKKIQMLLADAPTVDAVEVVRCRECKWWHEDDDIGHCDNPDGLDNYAKPDDFCSYGERKEGAD